MQMDKMTSQATNMAIALLCALQACKENESDVECTSDKIDRGEYESASLYHFKLREERLVHTRKQDFKRLLTACTKLIINEA